MACKGPFLRGESAWMAPATSSLPEPLDRARFPAWIDARNGGGRGDARRERLGHRAFQGLSAKDLRRWLTDGQVLSEEGLCALRGAEDAQLGVERDDGARDSIERGEEDVTRCGTGLGALTRGHAAVIA